ncbi:MAG: hypothetical protein KGI03_04300 [Patescibacteria group bacterium]|nr:hypothetical protein [Patescibacteria group bacterium]
METERMSDETKLLLAAAHGARYQLKIGAVGYAEAKKAVEPYIRHVNARARVLAGEYGVPFRPVSAVGFLR